MVTCIKTSHELLLFIRAQLFYKTTFSLSQSWPRNTGLIDTCRCLIGILVWHSNDLLRQVWCKNTSTVCHRIALYWVIYQSYLMFPRELDLILLPSMIYFKFCKMIFNTKLCRFRSFEYNLLFQIFCKFGKVQKMIIFTKNSKYFIMFNYNLFSHV